MVTFGNLYQTKLISTRHVYETALVQMIDYIVRSFSTRHVYFAAGKYNNCEISIKVDC